MKYYNIHICEAYNQIILEDISNKILIQSQKIWNTIPEEEVKTILENFLLNIRHKVKTPDNDINFWFKKPFSEFKNFVENYKSLTQRKKEQKSITKITKDGKGIGIIQNDEYELWKVDSYKAAKELGRFYKGYSTSWCISTDNEEFWNNYYYGIENEEYDSDNDSDDDEWSELPHRIYFLIRKNRKNDDYDKIAILIHERSEYLSFWTVSDENVEISDIYKVLDIDFFKPYIKYYPYDQNSKEYIKYKLGKDFINACGHSGRYGDISRIKKFVDNGVDLKSHGESALMKALKNKIIPTSKYLIELGIPITKDNYGNILYYGSKTNNFELIKIIIEKCIEQGFDVNYDSMLVWLYRTTTNIDTNIIKYLLSHGADIHHNDNQIIKRLVYNFYDKDYGDIFKFLIDNKHITKEELLKIAVNSNHFRSTKYFIDIGADINTITDEDFITNTVLKNTRPEIINLFKNRTK